ncbi:Inositol 2-dehydrogenase/D-chiro-inositol 3-dehydrogenase [Paraburkholderia rhynchosiae]|uniref:Gfo/Idh/MocA family oxidoreductase n=1 Tax=Paraburkholderia rhynchosiae TaxID=487049 RepID=A0A2N7VP55_9BURK|nr:gfo/Idh/MocA family oxidoreductase [Paraburkholderia rhynchosiae]CAB3743449.1 Inositol 2-dehydrogenase/D-chiro-inositol 3-dehydrogenase [Paraburkholderia rhynchosiae]
MQETLGPIATFGVACLGITHPHTSGRVRAMQRMENTVVLGAADDSPLLKPFIEAMGITARSTAEILDDPAVHAVLVHSKSEKMADLAVEALEAGKAVLVEKPAGRSAADSKRILDASEKSGGLVQVGYCWRFAPSVEAMQQALLSGRLGKVMQVRAHGGCCYNEARTSHLNQAGDIGGAVFVIGCHLFDRIIYHFGMPLSVNARITKFHGINGDDSREDAAGAVLNYADKIVVVDFFSWDPLNWTETWDMAAYGTEGIMQSCALPSSYKIFDKGNTGYPQGWTEWNETNFPVNWSAKKTEYSPELYEIGNPIYFDREAAAFVGAIRNGTPSVVSAKQGHDVNVLIEALYASSKFAGGEVVLNKFIR